MPDTFSSANISLDANLNLMAAAPLAQSLTDILTVPVELDAAKVSHIDQPCLQILLAASRHWHSSGVVFEIKNMSQAFLDSLTTLGLKPSIFENSEFA